MRVWQKIYLTTLLLFLLMLNAGLFLAAGFIFGHNLDIEKQQAETDCYFLSQNLAHDFSILEQSERFEPEIIQAVVTGYQNYYEKRNITFTLEQQEKVQETRLWSEVKNGGSTVIVGMDMQLAAPYQEYVLSYTKESVEFENLWRSIKQTFVIISLLMSLVLCVLLYFLMQRILRPLERLNCGVEEISNGNYHQNIKIEGKDEFAELAAHVNQMSEIISGQIATLELENDRKQQLMDNMAHELRTPLTSIYGYAEYLQRAKTTEEEFFEGLSYIMSESKRLNQMGEMMLSMRLYQQEELEKKEVSLDTLTQHVVKLLASKIEEKQIDLQIDMEMQVISGDETLLINVFRNLIENAIRASKNGGVIRWSGKKEANTVFCIQDYGIGMDATELHRITEPFYRVDKARSRANGGAGLGLSITKLIVEKHGGRLEFASEKSLGTTVTVILP